MFNGISWGQFAGGVFCLLAAYYAVVAWLYRKDLLQWLRGRKK